MKGTTATDPPRPFRQDRQTKAFRRVDPMRALRSDVGAESRAGELSQPPFDLRAGEERRRSTGDDGGSRRLAGIFGMTGKSRRWPGSIQARLVWIVLILAAPALVGLMAIALGLYQHERDQIAQSTLATARALVSALDRDLAGTMAAAQVLAKSPSLASHDLAAFYREAKSVLPLLRGSAVLLADADGQQIINTRVPYGTPLPARAERVNHNKVFETGLSSVSGICHWRHLEEPGDQYRCAGISGSARRVFPRRRGRAGEAERSVPESETAGRLGRHHHRLLRGHCCPLPRSRTGRAARAGALECMAPSQPGLVETHREDGTPIIVGFRKSEVSNWTVAIGVPISDLYRKPNVVLLYGAASVVCALMIGLVTATYQSRRITRAVRGLIPSALALGGGAAPNARRLDVCETDEVARALELAHELLQVRTLERDNAEMTIAARSFADEMFRLAVEPVRTAC